MFKKITNNLLTSSIAALIVVGFLVGIGFAVGGGIVSPGTFTSGASQKGLVGQWRLDSDSEAVGTAIWDDDASVDGTANWNTNADAIITFVSDHYELANNTYAHGMMKSGRSFVDGQTYRVSVMLKDGTASGKTIRLQIHDGSVWIGENVVTTSEWVKYNIELTATNTTSSGQLGIHPLADFNNSNIKIKNISIKPLQIADQTPYSNNGTVHGADIRNHGYSFNGSSDYISMGNTNNVTTNDFTISAWINTDVVTGNEHYIVAKRESGVGGKGFLCIIDNVDGRIQAQIDDDNAAAINWYGVTDITDGQWHHVVCVADRDGNGSIYVDGLIDGAPVNISGSNLTLEEPDRDFVIGVSNVTGSLGSHFDGNIADVRMFNSALTATQILDLYNGSDISSPVGWWKLDKGADDFSGNGNDGTITSANLVGEAAYFDGVDDYVSIDTDSLDDLPNSDFSVTAWAKFNVLGENIENRIFNKRQSAEGWFFEHTGYGGSGQISMFVDYTGTNANTKSSVGSVVVDTWYHLVGVFDSSTNSSKVYINGTEDSSSVTLGTGSILSDAAKDLFIGVDNVGGNNMNGYLSDARIYNRALSDSEIQSLYNGGSQSEQYISIGSDQKGLIGHWKLDQDSEKVGVGKISSSNNGNFEEGTKGNWSYNSPDSGTGTVDYSADFPSVGDKNLKLTTTHAQYSRAALQSYSLSAFTTNKTYRFSMDVYLLSGHNYTSAGIGASQFTGVSSTSEVAIDLAKVDQWQHVSSVYTFAADVAGYIYLQTYGASFSADGEFVYLDNISFKEVHTKDSTPNSNNGIIQGVTYIEDHQEQADKAMNFDGAGEINLTEHLSDYNTLTEGTISFWGYELGANSAAFSMGTTLTSNNLVLIGPDTSNQLYVLIKNAGGDVLRAVSSTAKSAGWHHYTYSSDSSGNYFYIDGEVQPVTYTSGNSSTSAFFNHAYSATQNFMYLGLYTVTAGSPHFTGNLSDVRIYNRVLSLKEIQDQYGSYNTELRTGSLTKGLVGSWDLKSKDEKMGTNIISDDFSSPSLSWWTSKGSGATVDVVNMEMDNDGTSSTFIWKDNAGLAAGKTYRLSWDISNYSSGNMKIYSGSVFSTDYFNTVGHYDVTRVVDGTDNVDFYSSSFIGSVANISLKEIQTKDSTPYSNHGDVYGATIGDDYTSFDGLSTYVTASDSSLPDGSSSRTFNAWIRASDTQDTWADILSYGSQSNNQAMLWTVTDDSGTGKPFIGKWGTNSGTANTAVDDNTWHMVSAVLTQNGTGVDIAFYLDGIADGTSSLTSVSTVLGGSLNFGTKPGADNYWYNGDMAYVKIYNRALLSVEVLELYNKGR